MLWTFLFCLVEGRLDVTKDGQKVLTLEPEDMFGEVALLYNSTHTYSVSGKHRADVSAFVTPLLSNGDQMGGLFDSF